MRIKGHAHCKELNIVPGTLIVLNKHPVIDELKFVVTFLLILAKDHFILVRILPLLI